MFLKLTDAIDKKVSYYNFNLVSSFGDSVVPGVCGSSLHIGDNVFHVKESPDAIMTALNICAKTLEQTKPKYTY